MALARTGRIEEAIHHFEQALRLRPDDAEAHTDLGVVLAGMGRIEEATNQFEQALQINPDDAEAHYNLGNVFLQEGKFSDAIVHFEQALRLKPILPWFTTIWGTPWRRRAGCRRRSSISSRP